MAIYIDDRELVAAHRAGDGDAFDELVREHRSSLHRHARRKLMCDAAAEDAVQETLVRAYRALPKFDGEYRLGPWLHRIMANVCIDEANRRRRDGDKANKLAAQPNIRIDAPSVEDELGLGYDDVQLDAALRDLSDPHREALFLRFVDELDYDQVAEMAGVSEQNARARVSRARNAMKLALKGVATLPLFLIGLLKRGEKAAAAATSTGGVIASGAGSSTASAVSAAAVVAPSALPTVAEATIALTQVAPTVVPVIAKAAVGIGLVAAVFTPTSDSAVHQAVENFATGAAGVVVEDTSVIFADSVNDEPVVVASVLSDNSTGTDGFAPIETESPSDASESSNISDVEGNKLSVAPASASVNSFKGHSGSLMSDDVTLTKLGGGRHGLSGSVVLSVDGVQSSGSLVDSSWVRIEQEADADGRQRIDGLLEVRLNGNELISLRIAGFGFEEMGHLKIAGLFRADANSIGMTESGSFSGILVAGESSGPATLTFNP
jgi:RNA polymerase sigma-70 factor (ECF subfamily)